jgi:hypothetical protein
MREIYLKLLVAIIVILWIIYFITPNNNENVEGFTTHINSFYRPHVRRFRNVYESFVNNYGPNVIITKLRKWNII